VASTATAARLCPDLRTTPVRVSSLPCSPPAGAPRSQPAISLEERERERLLLLHLPQVRLIAETLRERSRLVMEFDDLVGYGVIGLLKAIERFDSSRGVLLKTYAEHRIRGAILDGLRALDWLPRSARQKERQYQESLYQAQSAMAASGSTCGERSQTTVPARFATPRTGNTDKPIIELPVPPRFPMMELIYAGGDLGEFEKVSQKAGLRGLLGETGEDPETLYRRKQMRERLARGISRLPRRHRQMVDLYYRQELSMKQIAQILRVHESRVSQLHAAAIKRLRAYLAPAAGSRMRLAATPRQNQTQPPARKPSKYFVAAAQSSSVSTPMVSSAVSAT